MSALAHMDEQIESARRLATSDAYWAQELPRLEATRAAVAELIAADLHYDDAQYGLARARYNGTPLGLMVQHCAKADIRRAAALAHIGGTA